MGRADSFSPHLYFLLAMVTEAREHAIAQVTPAGTTGTTPNKM